MTMARGLCLVGVLMGCLALALAKDVPWDLNQCLSAKYYCPGTGKADNGRSFRSGTDDQCPEIFHTGDQMANSLERVVYGYLQNSLFYKDTNTVLRDNCKAWYRMYISMQNTLKTSEDIGLSDQEYENLLDCVKGDSFKDFSRYTVSHGSSEEELLRAVQHKMVQAVGEYTNKAYQDYSDFNIDSADRTENYGPMEKAAKFIANCEWLYNSPVLEKIVNMKAVCDKFTAEECPELSGPKGKADGWANHMEQVRTKLNAWKASKNLQPTIQPREPSAMARDTTFTCSEAVATAKGFESMLGGIQMYIDPPSEFQSSQSTLDKLTEAIESFNKAESAFNANPSHLLKLNRSGRKEASEAVAEEIRALNLESIALEVNQMAEASPRDEVEHPTSPTGEDD